MNRKQTVQCILILLYMIALAGGSLLPISIEAEVFSGSDKLIHFLLYTPLGFLLSLPNMFSSCFLNIVVPLAFGSLYGASMEVLQSFAPGRIPSWYDAAANVLGVGLGLTIAGTRRWMKGRREGKN
jgi:VanZ family protein